ncbi:lactonase family protein [Formosa haliotis]|uniref:lactonase family protein n=1 Tax=Formosa haliotis TaxID=1555194 RepID=UPI0008245E72|nr:lactonase family protein [Formosa haliotis]
MKTFLSILSLCLILSCSSHKSSSKKADNYSFFVGTYTTKDSKGIYKYALNKDGSFQNIGLQAITESPSFISLSANKDYLVAGNKLDPNPGSLTAFAIEGDSLILKNAITSGGKNPCHVAINKDNYVIAANYGSGTLGLFHLKNDGHLSNLLDTQQHIGKGTTSRQEGPHAHSSYFVPNSDEIITIDLGTNGLWFYKINKENNTLQPNQPLILNMAEGAGPRHLTFHPNNKWIYIVNELNNTVTRIERSGEGQYAIKESTSIIPNDFKGSTAAADIHISSDGKFLYASNRGHNSIAIFTVNEKNGELTSLGFESTRGETPRNFSLSPHEDFIVVANQNSDNLVSFKRDKKTGLLTFAHEIKAPTPSCVIFE